VEILEIPQGEPEWFDARRGIPTASCAGKIITPKTGKLSASAETYVAELIAETLESGDETQRSYWMERGILYEQEARDWYEFATGNEVRQVGIVLNNGAGWSPDGLVDPDGGIEIKCPKLSTHIKYLLAGELPDEYRPQIHAGMWIGERMWMDFVSYHPSVNSLLIRVLRDDYTEKVGKALAEFCEMLEIAKDKML